jgi:hypothetical protein
MHALTLLPAPIQALLLFLGGSFFLYLFLQAERHVKPLLFAFVFGSYVNTVLILMNKYGVLLKFHETLVAASLLLSVAIFIWGMRTSYKHATPRQKREFDRLNKEGCFMAIFLLALVILIIALEYFGVIA